MYVPTYVFTLIDYHYLISSFFSYPYVLCSLGTVKTTYTVLLWEQGKKYVRAHVCVHVRTYVRTYVRVSTVQMCILSHV